jgi:hypothetical protein
MDKDKIHVLFDTDADGYIIGYQQEFYDGKAWKTPFDTTNAVQLSEADTATIVLGATKYADGQLVIDTAKQAAIKQATQPIDYEAKVAELEAKLQEATNATLELADAVLGGDTNDASAS